MSATTDGQRSIDLVRRFNDEVFNARRYDLLPEFQSADYVQHGPLSGMELHGNEASVETMRAFHAAFSDLHSTPELSFSDADGEYVCSVYTYRGTHDGDFFGVPPTDADAEVRGIVVNRVADGKIAETWVVSDLLGVLQQVGVVTPWEDRYSSI